MQSIAIYLNVDGHVATPVDEYNAVRSTPPALMRGVRTLLCLRLVDTEGEPDDDQVTDMTSWEFALAGDWDTTTDPEILVTEDIAVVQTTVGDKTYNEIQIPLTEMNTEELIEQLGNTAKADLGAELVGYDDGETDPGFLIQFTMRVCNRRSTAGTGTPTQVSDGMYTAAQIDSLMTNYYTSVQVDDALSGYALTTHNHNDVYSLADHNHDGMYAAVGHGHTISEIADLESILSGKAAVDHNHEGVYAVVGHRHDSDYAALTHEHGVSCLAGSEISLGMLVYLADTVEGLTCYAAANSGTDKHLADGFVAGMNDENALVKTTGLLALSNSLSAESETFLGLNGDMMIAPPTQSGDLVQKVGRVINGNQIFFAITQGRQIV